MHPAPIPHTTTRESSTERLNFHMDMINKPVTALDAKTVRSASEAGNRFFHADVDVVRNETAERRDSATRSARSTLLG